MPLPIALGDQRRELAAALETRIEQAHGFELVDRRSIVVEMLALPAHLRLPGNSEPAKILVNGGFVFRPAAHRIDILDAQQQPAIMLPRHLVVDQRRIGMAEMQIAIRTRREPKHPRMHRHNFPDPQD